MTQKYFEMLMYSTQCLDSFVFVVNFMYVKHENNNNINKI